MKTCSKCGSIINLKAKICPSCGKKFETEPDTKLYSVKIKNDIKSHAGKYSESKNNSNTLQKTNKANVVQKTEKNATNVAKNNTGTDSPPKYQFILVLTSIFLSIFWSYVFFFWRRKIKIIEHPFVF